MTASARFGWVTRGVCLGMACAACRLAQATVVSGHVTDSVSHLPIDGASISVSYESAPPLVEFATTTDAGGYYEGDVAPGSYRLGVSKDTYLLVDMPVEVGVDPLVVDIPMSHPASISGTVRFQGAGVPYAEVTLLDAGDGSATSWAEADANGGYALPSLFPGSYAVCVIDSTDAYLDSCYNGFDVPASGVRAFTPLTLQSGQSIDLVDFDLHTGSTISGNVYDRYSSAPILFEELEVVLYSTMQTRVSRALTNVDENGHYSIAGISPGDYYVRAGVPFEDNGTNGYYTPALYGGGDCTDTSSCPFSEDKLVSVPLGGDTPGIDFQLRPGHRISGRVSDADSGMGLAGVSVMACEAAGLDPETAQAETGMDGTYALDHIVGPGPVSVSTIDAAGHVDQVWPGIPLYHSVFCPPGGEGLEFASVDEDKGDIDFALGRPGTISGHAPRTNDAAWATVVIVDANTLQTVWTGSTDENQDYLSDDLPAGGYYVAAYFNDGQDCRVYAGYTCTAPGDSPVVDPAHATPVTLLSGQALTGVDLPAAQLVFRDGFDPSN